MRATRRPLPAGLHSCRTKRPGRTAQDSVQQSDGKHDGTENDWHCNHNKRPCRGNVDSTEVRFSVSVTLTPCLRTHAQEDARRDRLPIGSHKRRRRGPSQECLDFRSKSRVLPAPGSDIRRSFLRTAVQRSVADFVDQSLRSVAVNSRLRRARGSSHSLASRQSRFTVSGETRAALLRSPPNPPRSIAARRRPPLRGRGL